MVNLVCFQFPRSQLLNEKLILLLHKPNLY
jgi:hypothetical protein